ncbi:Putative inorganic phosphate cotransporter [Eumeta japonica]|uniref:Inorganic phosphate cotransporter n=1 Tax=Eumeta variegata TaxID=151549 RepID=A0A4C2AB27_EUMVA|nr:Putative inorganic phosphate cotransporter [Eumeta japonica]
MRSVLVQEVKPMTVICIETSAAEWRKVFYVSSGAYFVCNMIFVLLGSSERQPWNDSTPDDEPEEIKETPVVNPPTVKRTARAIGQLTIVQYFTSVRNIGFYHMPVIYPQLQHQQYCWLGRKDISTAPDREL